MNGIWYYVWWIIFTESFQLMFTFQMHEKFDTLYFVVSFTEMFNRNDGRVATLYLLDTKTNNTLRDSIENLPFDLLFLYELVRSFVARSQSIHFNFYVLIFIYFWYGYVIFMLFPHNLLFHPSLFDVFADWIFWTNIKYLWQRREWKGRKKPRLMRWT